jgi:transposase
MATGIFQNNFPQTVELQQKTKQSKYIIGLDLHKKTTAITIIETNSEKTKPVFQRKRLENNKLLEIINKYIGLKVVVAEAAYGFVQLEEALRNLPDVIFIPFDARKTSIWANTQGIKSDKVDSEVLAYACLNNGVGNLAVYQPSKESRDNFKLVIYRDGLIKQRTRIKNQLRAVDRNYGENPYTEKIVKKPDLIKNMENDLLDNLNFLNDKISKINKQIETISKEDKIIPLLRSILGIGEITSFALRFKIDSMERFKDAKHLCSYFGLAVRQYQSGNKFNKGKITKTGNSLIRTLLIEGAQCVRNRCPEYLSLCLPNLANEEKMKHKIHANKTVVALARKNLTFIYSCWKNNRTFKMKVYQSMREKNSKDTNISVTKNMYPQTADPDLSLIQ